MNSGLALAAEGGKWKRYPAYRDSGVEWLGAVPERWSSSAVKHNYTIQLGKMLQNKPDSDEDILVPYAKALYVLWGNVVTDDLPKMWANPSDIQQYGIEGGDLLVCEGGEVGRAGVVTSPPEQCIIQNALHRARAKKSSEVYFLQYVLHAVSSSTWFDVLCNKATIAHFTREKFADLGIPVPPLPEQRTIATFLDHETGRIDALIAKKERQIELLQEKRTALISHAVTKGLDPDAPMKDSGVEWMGDVPERWGVKQFKRVTTRVDVGIAEAATHAYADEGVPIIRSTNVRPGRIFVDDLLYIHEWFAEKNRSKYLFANDLLTVRTGAPGTTAVIPPELHECQCFTMLISTLKTRQIPQFYSYFLNSSNARFRFAVEGWGTAQINISVPILQQQIIAEPPENEQRAITTFLDRETGHIDVLTTKVHESITKLREYRTSLISAAVTGKIDVRGELAP